MFRDGMGTRNTYHLREPEAARSPLHAECYRIYTAAPFPQAIEQEERASYVAVPGSRHGRDVREAGACVRAAQRAAMCKTSEELG